MIRYPQRRRSPWGEFISRSLSLFLCVVAAACAGSASAQTRGSAAASKQGTHLITLGTIAGPASRARRAQSSNLLIVNGAPYVIDAGDGVARRLAEVGINIRDIGTVFITHHHDDHTAGLGTLMSVAWDQQRIEPINVYGPPGTEALVKAAVQYFTLSSNLRIRDGGRTVPIARVFVGYDRGVGVIYQDANIKVTAVENTHFTKQATQGHLSPEDVGKMAARAGVKTVVLTHLTFTPNETDYAAWADDVRKHFSGRVVVADDLMEF